MQAFAVERRLKKRLVEDLVDAVTVPVISLIGRWVFVHQHRVKTMTRESV
jgi:hypothetical protein